MAAELRIRRRPPTEPDAQLEPGRDLVLTADERDVARLAQGTLAEDFLSRDDRLAVDAAAASALREWLHRWRGRLVVDGLDLTWLYETELLAEVFLRHQLEVTALARALEALQPSAVVVSPSDDLEQIVRLVDPDRPCRTVADEVAAPRQSTPPPRLRRRALDLVTAAGLPSHVRRGSAIVFGYWHLSPLIDRLLGGEGPPPAVVLDALPTGPGRALRAAVRGGIVGRASLRARRRTRHRVARVVAEATVGDADQDGLADALHRAACALLRARAPHDLAAAGPWRRALAGAPARIVVPNDVMPDTRVAVALAAEAGIPSLVVQHGVYLAASDEAGGTDERIGDLETADEVALWSPVTGAAIENRSRKLHVVGYPSPDSLVPRPGRGGPARFLVLVQPPERITSITSARMTVEHAETAILAALDVVPDAAITLRPHPSRPPEAMWGVAARFAPGVVTVDASTPIHVLAAGHDVCIGARSTATFQAAAVARVVVLNVTGVRWRRPLSGDAGVLVADSRDALARHLTAVLASDDDWPGRAELLDALGTPYGNGTDALVGLLQAGGQSSLRQ